MKIKYVGLKTDGETAFARDAGITAWLPGDSIEISNPGVAHRMLQHPDVFAVDDGKAAKASAKTVATPLPVEPDPILVTNAAMSLAPGAKVEAINLKDLDKAALHALAKERGVKVHHAAGADTVRTALEAAQ